MPVLALSGAINPFYTIGKRPALITAYLSTVINAAADNLPDPRHMDCLF